MTTIQQSIGSAFNYTSGALGEHVLYPALKMFYTDEELANRQGANNDFFHGLAERGDKVRALYEDGRIFSGITYANIGLAGESLKEGGRKIIEQMQSLLKGKHWNNIVVGALGAIIGVGAGSIASKIPIPGLGFLTGFFAPVAGGLIGCVAGFATGDSIMKKLNISLEAPSEPRPHTAETTINHEAYIATDYIPLEITPKDALNSETKYIPVIN